MNTEQPASPSDESARSSDPAPRAALSPLPPIGASGIENRPQHVPTEDLTGKLQELLAEEKATAQQREVDREQLFEQKMAVAEAGRVEPIYYDGGHYPPSANSMKPRDTSGSDSYVLQQLMAGMTQQRETINALVALQTEKSAVEDIAVEEEVKEPEANPYPQHGIPFLEGDKPQRPQYETYFEMPKMGTMSARYHAVVEGNDCLALLYDTRFEDGFQYLPPSLGEERVTVSVPKLNNSVFSCSSLGLHWSVGCMDVVILIKHSDLDKNAGGE